MKRKLIYLFIALAATILPAHAQKFLNDALTLSNVSLWQQGNSLYVGMTFDMKNLTIGSARSLSLIPLLTVHLRVYILYRPRHLAMMKPQYQTAAVRMH